MKCYKLILLIYLVTNSLFAQEQGTITYNGSNEVFNGDLIQLELTTRMSEKELEKLKFSVIQKQVYLVDFQNIADNLYTLDVFITNPEQANPKAGSSAPTNEKYKFELKNLNPKFDQARVAQKFEVLEIPYEIPKSYWHYYFLIFGIVALVLAIYLKTRPDRVLKRKRRERRIIYAKELKELIDQAKTREDFERIYKKRKDIQNLLEYDKNFKKFIKELDSIQYKKEWSPEDFNQVSKVKNKIDNLELKHGI